MPVTKKKKTMDRKLFAAKQSWEVRTVLKRYPSIPKETVLSIAKKSGRSRVKLYQALLDWVIKNQSK